jgi:hypothetical protein
MAQPDNYSLSMGIYFSHERNPMVPLPNLCLINTKCVDPQISLKIIFPGPI